MDGVRDREKCPIGAGRNRSSIQRLPLPEEITTDAAPAPPAGGHRGAGRTGAGRGPAAGGPGTRVGRTAPFRRLGVSVPQSSATLDAATARDWMGTALRRLGRAREEIDAINVYPVADADTGTNLYLTVESAVRALDTATGAAAPTGMPPGAAFRALAHGALLGARGNSGTILAQLLRGMSDHLGPDAGAVALTRALRAAAGAGYRAVAHPVEGTMLTVAAAAADAAESALRGCAATEGPEARAALAAVVTAAHRGAAEALAATPQQLAALRRAGVVDAGGRGLVVVLEALAETVLGHAPDPVPATGPPAPACAPACEPPGVEPGGGPAFEVTYLLDADTTAVEILRGRLDALGDSLVVVGGDRLWNIHVHVDDAGAAVEAGVEAGRPHRISVTHFADAAARRPSPAEPPGRAVVAVAEGDGLAALFAGAGAVPVGHLGGRPPGSAELTEAIRRTGAREVVVLPCDDDLRDAAAAAAEQARAEGLRVAIVPTRSAVHGIAALAVHQAGRRFDEDVVAMTAAAGATRFAELAVAEREAWTMAGVCQAGEILGMIDGDVAVIGQDLSVTAVVVLDRMLAAGGELVTLVLGAGAPDGLADRLSAHVQARHLAVDTVVYDGGRPAGPLLIGVE